MSIKKIVKPRKKTMTVELPDRDATYVRSLDQSQLGTVLTAILGSKRANQDLTQVVLKGGKVRAAAAPNPGEVSWQKTVWRRSGPLVTGEELINPVDLTLPERGGGGI